MNNKAVIINQLNLWLNLVQCLIFHVKLIFIITNCVSDKILEAIHDFVSTAKKYIEPHVRQVILGKLNMNITYTVLL